MVSVVVVGDGSKVNLVFIFGPRLKLCSLDLDQAEQQVTGLLINYRIYMVYMIYMIHFI